jgi:hypothetical protein
LIRLEAGPTHASDERMIVWPRSFAFTRRALAMLALALLWPSAAHAQAPDALPTLDESAPVAAPEAPPPAPLPEIRLVKREPDRRPLLPIRARRRLALLGEVGWNGIAGFGPNLVFHLDRRFSLDLGAGLSLLGWKVGLRGRYNFMDGPVTPFIGVGGMAAAGFGDSPIPINDAANPSHETLNIKVLPSAWVQTVAGVDWTSESGFTLLGTAGYAFLLSHDPVEIVSGTPTADEQRGFDIAFRSNIVATVGIGYSFR